LRQSSSLAVLSSNAHPFMLIAAVVENSEDRIVY
jgi:hypothetical protein